MQQQHNKNWEDGWLNESFIDIIDDRYLDDTADLDDIRAQSAVSFPQSVITDGDNITEPPTPVDLFRPITPSPDKNQCQTPATDSISHLNLRYLSRDVLDDFDSQTLGDYDNLNRLKMFFDFDIEQNDNQPMSDESYDEYNYRNGPTSCSSVNHHDSESLEREKRKAVSLEDDELREIVHAKRRRLTESSSQQRLSDELDSLNKPCTRNTSQLNSDTARTCCQGRPQKQPTREARQRHSSLPDSGHLQNIGSTPLHPLGTFGSTPLHPLGTFPAVDVNGNFSAQLVTTSNNARPQSPLLPPVSSFCGTAAINTPGPVSPYPVLNTETLSSLNVDTLSPFNTETLLSIIQTSQTNNEALHHLDSINQTTGILHSVYPSSDHSGHLFETSANELYHLPHQSPCDLSVTFNENNYSPTTINNHCLPLVSNSQSDMLPLVANSQSDMLPLVANSQSDMLPLVANFQSDMLSVRHQLPGVIENLCLAEITTHGIENFMTHLTPAPRKVSKNLLQSSNKSGDHQITDVTSPASSYLHLTTEPTSRPSYLPQTSVPTSGPSYLPETAVPTSGPSYLPQNSVPTSGPSYLPQNSVPTSGPSYHHQTSEPYYLHLSPEPSYLHLTLEPTPGPSYLPQTSKPTPGTSEPTPGPSYLPQTSKPTPGTSEPTPGPSYLPQASEPTPGPTYLHPSFEATIGPTYVTPKLPVQNDSSVIAQLPIDTIDPHLAETYHTACRQNSTEGLTKYILKTKILLRKNRCDQTNIETKSEPQVKYEMTPEELEKSQQRKELNRLAAAKHRLSKKEKMEKNEKEYDEQLKRKHELEEIVKLHTDKKNMLISCLLNSGISIETIQKALQ